MLALNYLYHMLATFRPLFSRHTPWVLFCVVILGFIGTPHLEGLTSLCRFWFMEEADYHRLLHFFHSGYPFKAGQLEDGYRDLKCRKARPGQLRIQKPKALMLQSVPP